MPTQYIQIPPDLPTFRQAQINHAIFHDLVASIGEVTTFSKDLRDQLSSTIQFPTITPVKTTESANTTKVLFQVLSDKLEFESVLMRHKDGRNTVCVSTQIGCAMGCKFCATGRMGFSRNLSEREIVDQVLYFARELKNTSNPNPDCYAKVTNIVYMGMGEPFLNPVNTTKSIAILTDPDQFGLGSRHITISTIGLPKQMQEFFDKFPQINLAISLHSAIPEKRAQLMPKAAKAASIEDLAKYISRHISKTGRRVSVEYILISNENDGLDDIDEMENFFDQIGSSAKKLVHVNIIPFNDITQTEYKSPSRTECSKFRDELQRSGINATIRVSMGQESRAACGMLAGEK